MIYLKSFEYCFQLLIHGFRVLFWKKYTRNKALVFKELGYVVSSCVYRGKCELSPFVQRPGTDSPRLFLSNVREKILSVDPPLIKLPPTDLITHTIMDMLNDKRRNVLTHVRVNFSQS